MKMIPQYKKAENNCLQKINISNLLKNQSQTSYLQNDTSLTDADPKNFNPTGNLRVTPKNDSAKSKKLKQKGYISYTSQAWGSSCLDRIKDSNKSRINNKENN